MLVGGLKKWRRDQKSAAGKMKEWTQNKDGCRKRLAVAHRGTSFCARVAWQKKKETDRKVARCRRDIFRTNMTQEKC
jgi:hypothetical protein